MRSLTGWRRVVSFLVHDLCVIFRQNGASFADVLLRAVGTVLPVLRRVRVYFKRDRMSESESTDRKLHAEFYSRNIGLRGHPKTTNLCMDRDSFSTMQLASVNDLQLSKRLSVQLT